MTEVAALTPGPLHTQVVETIPYCHPNLHPREEAGGGGVPLWQVCVK
jgi:hypothetical protein